MKGSKLINHLGVLTQREMNAFGDFVRSPCFNKHRETVVFFDLLQGQFGRLEKLTKKDVFEAVYPGEKYREHSINNLMFNLMDLFKQFIGQQVYKNSPERKIDQMEGGYQKGLWKLSRSLVNKEISRIENNEVKWAEDFKQLSHLHQLNDTIYNRLQQKIETKSIQQAVYSYDTWIIIEKLRMSCDLFTRMIVYDYDYDLGMIRQVLDYIEERWDYFGKILLVNLYYQILVTYLEPKKHEHFFKFVQLLEEHRGKCNMEDTKRLYDYALNLGIEFLNLDAAKFSKTVYKLYLLLIEDGLHIENGEIDHMRYKNILVLACRHSDFEWARKFMDDHRLKLNVSLRKNTYNFNLAHFHYFKGEYQEALVLLSKLNYENVFYQINSKMMQLKIFFELKEYDVLLSFLESFRLFLIRNKTASVLRMKMTLNFVHFVRRIVQVLNTRSVWDQSHFNKVFDDLYKEIQETTEPLIGKDWLLETINGIKGSSISQAS